MTVNIFPPVHDVLSEHPTPSGFNSPLTIIPPTHDSAVTHRPLATSGSGGPGAIVHAMPEVLPEAAGRYTIRIADRIGGNTGGTLLSSNPGEDKWTISSIKWTLNGLGGATISGPVHDPELVALYDFAGNVRDDRELQLGRDDLGVLQVVIPSPRISLGPGTRRIEMQCPGVAYHLTRKYIGRNNEAPNLVTNGSFDTDTTGWTASSLSTMLWAATPNEDGVGSLRLTSALAGQHYAKQTVNVDSLPYSTFVWLNAWCLLDAAINVNSLPTSGRGLWTVLRVGSTVVWQQGVSPDWRNADDWQNLATKIFFPANQNATMEIRLYCPVGAIHWDAIVAHREERLSCEGSPGSIIGCLVAHAQDGGYNKINMNITADDSRGEGTASVIRRYKFAEAAQIANAMNEMATIQGGCDWLCETPNETTRTVFTMERTGYDDSGNITLTWGDNLTAVEDVWNPDRRADQVRVQGRGSGDEVTEAFWDDETSDQGWEFIRRTSIEGTPHPQDQADGMGRLFRRPLTLALTVNRTVDFDPGMACFNGWILPGRLVTVKVVEGVVNINERFKILDTELIPAGGGQPGEIVKLQVTPVAMLEDV